MASSDIRRAGAADREVGAMKAEVALMVEARMMAEIDNFMLLIS
jgi:hypothetical protein